MNDADGFRVIRPQEEEAMEFRLSPQEEFYTVKFFATTMG